MKPFGMISMVLASALVLGGCVSKNKYNAVLADSKATRTALEQALAQKNALEQQVKSLKDLNAKLSDDVALTSTELRQIKDIQEKERASIASRIRELDQRSEDLSAQYKALLREYEDLKTQDSALKATLARYQKELRDRQQTLASLAPRRTSKPVGASTTERISGKSGVHLSEVPAELSSKGGPTPINLNTASANDLVLFLGLTREVADKVVKNRPYRLKGELMAKNVLPRSTFDVIKDRITTTP